MAVPEKYMAVAKPLDDSVPVDMDWAIEKGWAALWRKHAQECQAYLFGHQQKRLEFFEQQITFAKQWEILNAKLGEWFGFHGSLFDQGLKNHVMHLAQHYVSITIRQTVPTVVQNQHGAETTTKKMQSSLVEAHQDVQGIVHQRNAVNVGS